MEHLTGGMGLNHKIVTFKQSIKFVFEMDPKTWQALDTQKERDELSQLIDDALRGAGLGQCIGSYARRTSLWFYCMDTDEDLARTTVRKDLSEHHLIRFLQTCCWRENPSQSDLDTGDLA